MNRALLFAIVVSNASAAEDLQVYQHAVTNAYTGAVILKEYFIRAGRTNMLRSTTRTNGVVKTVLHRFYHQGQLVADHLFVPSSALVQTSTYNGFGVGFTHSSNILTEVRIADSHDSIVDWFVSTNGALVPLPTIDLLPYTSRTNAGDFKDR